jgi:hypothetical protein
MYEAQLNAYAHIGERAGLSPVTDDAAAQKDTNTTGQGFLMEFSAHILPVELKPKLVPKLLKRVREIYDLPRPPGSSEGCEDCPLLENLLAVASGD